MITKNDVLTRPRLSRRSILELIDDRDRLKWQLDLAREKTHRTLFVAALQAVLQDDDRFGASVMDMVDAALRIADIAAAKLVARAMNAAGVPR